MILVLIAIIYKALRRNETICFINEIETAIIHFS
jgi:hypothetical protein